MRTEQAITAELNAARAAYHEASATETGAQLYARAQAIKLLRSELSAVLSDGAEACKGCGGKPHGRLKTPAHRHRGRRVPAVYEVYCADCRPAVRGGEVVHPRASGSSPAEAAAAWNAGEFNAEPLPT